MKGRKESRTRNLTAEKKKKKKEKTDLNGDCNTSKKCQGQEISRIR